MLNEGLYVTLQKVFGKVVVENTNQKASIAAAVRTAVTSKLGRQEARITGYGEQYRVNCPFCHQQPDTKQDTGKHLWISYVYDTDITMDGHTYNFGWNPARCYRRDCMDSQENRKALYAMIRAGAAGNAFIAGEASESEDDPNNPPKIDFPIYMNLTDRGVPDFVHEYLAKRGVTALELERDWGVVLGDDPFYRRPSLIFPIYQRGVYVSWQSRFIGDDLEKWSNGEEKPKYHIPSGTKKSWMVYNMDRAKFTSPGVLVEGVMDCVKVGEHGLGLFGKKISEYQMKLISSYYKTGKLIWLPDMNDPKAIITADKQAEWMRANNVVKEIKVIRLLSDDPGSFTREELWQLINKK